jgi:hypothetical protein
MSHSFSQNHIHLIFSTKDRSKSIPKEMLPRLCSYLGGICTNHEMTILAVSASSQTRLSESGAFAESELLEMDDDPVRVAATRQ